MPPSSSSRPTLVPAAIDDGLTDFLNDSGMETVCFSGSKTGIAWRQRNEAATGAFGEASHPRPGISRAVSASMSANAPSPRTRSTRRPRNIGKPGHGHCFL